MISKKDIIVATWIIELNCECPNCKEYVNLFVVDIPRYDTEKNIKAHCPDCNHETLDILGWSLVAKK